MLAAIFRENIDTLEAECRVIRYSRRMVVYDTMCIHVYFEI